MLLYCENSGEPLDMQEKKYAIKDWPVDDRPREKLLSKSPSALSNSELLAILLAKGHRRKNAIEVAKEVMLLGRNNLNELAKLSAKELMKINGVGLSKAVTISAALELGRRRQASELFTKPIVSDSKDIASYLKALLQDLAYEVFAIVFLNKANKVNHFEIISEGGMTATVADPRIILKRALEEDAVSLILCHNHPSGSLRPSKEDEELTFKIKEAAKYLDIKLLDHIIVSEQGYFSFADEGLV